MGQILPPRPVLPLFAVFSIYPEAIDWARNRIAEKWGEIALASVPFNFDNTHYYDESMGAGLKKQFFVLNAGADPSDLIDWKILSNDWEEEYAQLAGKPESRPLNIDPGYIELGKLVLASTKDYAHRIYLGRGIYAEITLNFKEGQWVAHHWTFPDYQRADYHEFFNQARTLLKEIRRRAV